MKNLPLVSILIPTYNQPDYFRLALESAIVQDYPNIEIIVSDDSTDDRVKTVFDEYKNCGRDLKYLKHGGYTDESIGERSLANMENLLEHANGEFVNILFHDDLIYPKKISTMMKFFTGKKRDQIAIVSSVRNWIDSNGKILGESDTFDEMNLWRNGSDFFFTGEEVGRIIFMICGNFIGELSTVLIRRKDFYRDCVKKFSPGYFLGVRDRTMWDVSTYLEICRDGRGLVFLREPLSAFRLAGGNQNTYNGEIRFTALMDWLSFIAAAYLKKSYILESRDLILTLKHWLLIATRTTKDISQKNRKKPSLDLIDRVLNATESIQNQNYERAVDIGIEWIRKYSSDTFKFTR
ncbi:MAG: glycosyltransferase family 2 protein [Selenomonadaceae bacterium]|nr:glycosyltransferase family 2 protein [Selenomonadaceae bacterium]